MSVRIWEFKGWDSKENQPDKTLEIKVKVIAALEPELRGMSE